MIRQIVHLFAATLAARRRPNRAAENSKSRLLVLILAATFTLAGSARADLDDGLISYWPLDGNFADSVGQNDGILMGTDDEAIFEPGQFSDGVVLDGIDQFIEIQGDESEFDFVDQDFSISAWFRVDAFTKSWQALIAKGEGNRWRVHRRGGESIMTWNGGNADVPAGPTAVDDGEIHHFVGVSTADEVLMYIDGELEAIGPPPMVENNDMPVMIGENPDARNRTWEGLIDDVAIWGRALDEAEVSDLWNMGDGNTPTGDIGPLNPLFVEDQDTIGTRFYNATQSNDVFGPVQDGAPGLTGRIVTFDEHGVTLDNHTFAEEVLEDFEGTTRPEAYTKADLGGGAGTFPDTQPYPNGVADAGQDDFAVQLTAKVTIPAGEWAVGLGSDDGGQVTIEGIEFEDLTNDSFDDDQLRFEGNRGHAWTADWFTLNEPLETNLIASFHERGGGDSFEVAISDGGEDAFLDGVNTADWELLSNGAFGWEVTTTAAPLISADLNARVTASREMEFDVNGDTGESDQLAIENPDPNVFTTILDLTNGGDGLTFQIKSAGTVTSGEAFTIIGADQIVGTPTITSVDPAQTWVFDAATGRVCLDSCPGVGGNGDYNGDGVLDAADIDLQAAEMKAANPDLAKFDHNSDGVVNSADRTIWVKDLKGTWIGDSNFDNEFNSGDLVGVFSAGKYETGAMAGWAEGDWDGDMVFGSGDLVAAFSDGGYEQGPPPAAAAVPEPSSLVLALLSAMGLIGVARRRNG